LRPDFVQSGPSERTWAILAYGDEKFFRRSLLSAFDVFERGFLDAAFYLRTLAFPGPTLPEFREFGQVNRSKRAI